MEKKKFNIKVNGVLQEVCADGKAPLLFILRNELGLKAAKFGCGQGLCGACFVLLDGHPTQSCDVPLEAVENVDIRTAEGLAIERLRASFIEHQAAQCGYCMSGILVSASALMTADRRLSREEIAQSLERNLCRCGAHHRITEAIYHAQEV